MAIPVNPQHSPEARGFERIAHDAARRFQGRRLRIRNSPKIHRVGWYSWMGTLSLPGPACRTGWAGVDTLGDLNAVNPSEPVTCAKCRRAVEVEQPDLFTVDPAADTQLSLWV